MGFWPEAVAGLGTVYHPPEIFAVRLRDVLVWPRHNLLLTNKRAVVRDSTGTVLPITLRGWTERLFAPILDMAGVCFLFRGVHNNFYHTPIDNMARLYCLHLPPCTELTEIKLLLPTAPTALESFIFERYLPDNVSVEVIGTECLVRPETLIFASFPTRRSLTYLPRSYLEHVMPKSLHKRTRARQNRIFIARRESNRGGIRVIENEAALFTMLQARGFMRHFLEDLSFEEQIALFYDADSVVAPHGAGLSNLIFADSIDHIELFPARMTMPHYYYLALSCGHRYRYWRGNRDHFDDNFTVDCDAVQALLPECS